MKKLLFTPLITLSFFASAQMGELFYGQVWSDLPAFCDSVIKAVPSFYVHEITTSKTGKSRNVVFRDMSGNVLKADILKVTGSPDRISTIQLTGSFEILMKVYYQYILRGQKPADNHNGNCWPVMLVTTSQGQMPVSFCKNLSKSNSWTLGNKIPTLKN
jgi:hypothetical protein